MRTQGRGQTHLDCESTVLGSAVLAFSAKPTCVCVLTPALSRCRNLGPALSFMGRLAFYAHVRESAIPWRMRGAMPGAQGALVSLPHRCTLSGGTPRACGGYKRHTGQLNTHLLCLVWGSIYRMCSSNKHQDADISLFRSSLSKTMFKLFPLADY